MCTDGLSDLLTIDEIQNILNQESSIEESGKELVATANARGGYDNVTVTLMQVTRINEQADLPRQ